MTGYQLENGANGTRIFAADVSEIVVEFNEGASECLVYTPADAAVKINHGNFEKWRLFYF